MIYDIKEFLKSFFTSRLFVLSVVIGLFFAIVIARVFTLQIVKGASYQENFTLKIQKDLTVQASRGNIYDCNGNLLAYNELAYSITISDNQSYSSTSVKNKELNAELAELITMILNNGDSIYSTLPIQLNADNTFSYTVSGSSLKRFLADVFGKTSYDKLTYNETFGFNEQTATAEQVIDYLMHGSGMFGVNLAPTEKDPNPVQYDTNIAYYIVSIRYELKENRYKRYKSTVIAKNVSDSSVAYVNEHSDTLYGVSIQEDTIRKYNYSEYFSNIIGYTGTISEAEYDELKETDSSYTINDTIGRSGLEQYYENYLRGENGNQSVYVDNVGRILDVISESSAVAGNDIYISLDADLQQATYLMLEQEIAGIVYQNIKSGNIPMNDVYFALINNSILDITEFSDAKASDSEQRIYSSFLSRKNSVIERINTELYSSVPSNNNDLNEDMLDYITYIVKYLKESEILVTDNLDTSSEEYTLWKDGNLSPQAYLKYCISEQVIDISMLDVNEKYADTSEIFTALVDYIDKDLQEDTQFAKLVYHYMIDDGTIDPRDLCLALFDQGVIDYEDSEFSALQNGSTTPMVFLLEKINNIEITPAQLALDPCTGSVVITDVKTGELKALVSYPGYDNNRMANGVDADYYAKLQNDLSNPLYNYATQEKTACGSTFKMITATAGLAEGVISTGSQIECTGVFEEVDNKPKCWIYPGNHGSINVSEAIRDSCNIFFYTTGYNLSFLDRGIYDDASGISYITKYASLYGLNEKTGLEIQENTPEIATEYPVMAAIGQSNNNYTTVSLARYVTAVTSGKLYDYQLMSKIVDREGNVIESYTPSSTDISSVLSSEEWDAVHFGMKMVVEELETDTMEGLQVEAAGKTGTAQQVKTRPNHALFVGYAPYNNPQISIACRIAYGYTSHNAAGAAKNIMNYYFGKESLEEILAQKASGVNTSTSTSTDGFTD